MLHEFMMLSLPCWFAMNISALLSYAFESFHRTVSLISYRCVFTLFGCFSPNAATAMLFTCDTLPYHTYSVSSTYDLSTIPPTFQETSQFTCTICHIIPPIARSCTYIYPCSTTHPMQYSPCLFSLCFRFYISRDTLSCLAPTHLISIHHPCVPPILPTRRFISILYPVHSMRRLPLAPTDALPTLVALLCPRTRSRRDIFGIHFRKEVVRTCSCRPVT